MSEYEYDCHPCQRSFRLFQHYQDHMIHSNFHHYCARCDQDFVDEDAKQKHLWFSDAHYVCQWCDCEVGNYDAHFQKYHLRCDVCDQWCADPEDRHHHYRNRHSDLYCALCGILFTNHNNLRMHLKSSTHLGKWHSCPGGRCNRNFISRSALIQHFEAGTCVSGFNLEDVDREFSEYCDINQVFVRREWILPATQIDVLHSDTSGRFPCTSCPKLFRTGPELLAHLQSAKHKNRGFKAYCCPSPHCAKDRFYSLGNLLLHMENQLQRLLSERLVRPGRQLLTGSCATNHLMDIQSRCANRIVRLWTVRMIYSDLSFFLPLPAPFQRFCQVSTISELFHSTTDPM